MLSGAMHRVTTLAIVGAAICGLVPAQSSWVQLTPTTAPSPRAGHSMAYDSARDRVVLFGGWDGTAANDETWEFDGATWSQQQPLFAPPPRYDHASTFVTPSGTVLVHGGRDTGSPVQFFDDTWAWNGSFWVQHNPANVPLSRAGHSLAWHGRRQRAVMFGGFYQAATGPPVMRVNTIEWQESTADWVLMSPPAFPTVCRDAGMCWDPMAAHVIRYGGQPTTTQMWSYQVSWQPLTPPITAGPRFGLRLVSDPIRQRIVLFGRDTGPSDTLEWDGSTWTANPSASPPSTRIEHDMVWVDARQRVLLFGGSSPGGAVLGDTWAYEMTNPAGTTTFGSGCGGSNGVLTLSAATLPWIGDTFVSRVGNLTPASLPLAAIGFSNAAYAGGSLPAALLGLHPAGGPGCQLAVSPDATQFLTSTGHSALLTFPIPNHIALAGIQLHQQGLALTIGTPPVTTAIHSTNGLTLTIGAR